MIYFIQNTRTGHVKVGYARDPGLRLSNLQVGSPDRLMMLAKMPGDRALEKHLHRRLRGNWHRGEWYAISPRLVDELVECQEYIAAREHQGVLKFEQKLTLEEPLVFSIIVQPSRRAA